MSPSIPNEICIEIIGHLHHRRDKQALLSLSLVNPVLRHESQKILFRENVEGMKSTRGIPEEQQEKERATHRLFLQAVVDHPQRLGPLVVSYAQEFLSCDPAYSWEESDRTNAETRDSMAKLWILTVIALRYMVNLERFMIWPARETPRPTLSLLHGCTFQLKTLILFCREERKDDLAAFLLTQRRLQHLEIGTAPGGERLDWLPENACSNLISVGCYSGSIHTLAKQPGLIALQTEQDEWEEYPATTDRVDVLKRLKFLKIQAYMFVTVRDFPGIILSNIVLLDLRCWLLQNLPPEALASFPNLRVLGLHEGENMDDDEKCKEVVLFCFQQCRRLERMIQHHWEDYAFYTTYTISLAVDSDWDSAEIHKEIAFREHDFETAWWSFYKMDV